MSCRRRLWQLMPVAEPVLRGTSASMAPTASPVAVPGARPAAGLMATTVAMAMMARLVAGYGWRYRQVSPPST
ncbi:hypothetical protein D9M71_763690 [compost metagenome]